MNKKVVKSARLRSKRSRCKWRGGGVMLNCEWKGKLKEQATLIRDFRYTSEVRVL